MQGATSQRMAELGLPTELVHGLFVDGLVRVQRGEFRQPASGVVYMLTAAGAEAIGRDPTLIRLT